MNKKIQTVNWNLWSDFDLVGKKSDNFFAAKSCWSSRMQTATKKMLKWREKTTRQTTTTTAAAATTTTTTIHQENGNVNEILVKVAEEMREKKN